MKTIDRQGLEEQTRLVSRYVAGDLSRARRVIERTAQRIRGYAGDDAELLDIATSLEREIGRYADDRMDARMLKSEHFASAMVAESRSPDGKARRR